MFRLVWDAAAAVARVVDRAACERLPAWWSVRARVCEGLRCPHCRDVDALGPAHSWAGVDTQR